MRDVVIVAVAGAWRISFGRSAEDRGGIVESWASGGELAPPDFGGLGDLASQRVSYCLQRENHRGISAAHGGQYCTFVGGGAQDDGEEAR
jgi:hypothetical protein